MGGDKNGLKKKRKEKWGGGGTKFGGGNWDNKRKMRKEKNREEVKWEGETGIKRKMVGK